MKDFTNLISKNFRSINMEELKNNVSESIIPSLRVVMLMILVAGIAYPLLLVGIGQVSLPFQSNGSLLTFDGKVIGSKLISQEFKSDKFFHIRPASNSTSGVDPHITPDDAFSQVHRISNATGLPENFLRTAIQLNVERNKVSNVAVFAPEYVNVLEVNLDLMTGYPEVYQEFTNNMNITGVK
jgi:potassium-transporting ATPase KdpC subunit